MNKNLAKLPLSLDATWHLKPHSIIVSGAFPGEREILPEFVRKETAGANQFVWNEGLGFSIPRHLR
jgi:hypothetical protein